MKRLLLPLLLLATSAAQAATFTDSATVIRHEPIYGAVNDGSCAPATTASAGTPAANSVLGGLITAENGGALLGGLVGGVLGHQVGGGKGKTAATIVGTLGGALAGREIARNSGVGTTGTSPVAQPVCNAASGQQGVTGYRVTYDYHGQRDTVILPYDPGKKLQLQVTVQPLAQ